MKIVIVKEFKERAELDNYIRTTYGENPDNNKDISIEETEEELTKLMLDENKTVWGIKVRIVAKEKDDGR